MSSSDVVVRDPVYGDLTLNWKWMLGLGILMAVLGIVGLGMTYGITIIGVLWFGVIALIGGVAQVIDAWKYRGWTAFFAHVLVGLLYIGAGVVLIAVPIQSAWWLTLLIGAALAVTGVLRLIMAFQMKASSGAIWLGLTGLLSVALGIMIYVVVDLPTAEQLSTADGAQAWFTEWGWLIGLFIAIELIAHGAALVALALGAKGSAGRVPTRPLRA